MPKTPILYREVFTAEIRGSGNPRLIKQLEWNAVETELGTMVEPRQSLAQDSTTKVTNIDLTDAAYNKASMIDEGSFQNQYGTGGSGIMDYNT